MLMSHGARSAGEIDCPSCGPWASAGAAAQIAAQTARCLSVNIGRLSLLVDAPACDRIVVIHPAQAPLRNEGRARRLHHSGIIGGAALQHRRTAVPLPWGSEAYRRL